jgi:hypothetical protein
MFVPPATRQSLVFPTPAWTRHDSTDATHTRSGGFDDLVRSST